MIDILKSKRSSIALIGMFLLFTLGYSKGSDVGVHIATICMAVAASNAYEKVKSGKS